MSARDRIRAFFEQNVGKMVSTHQIRRVAGISEYARRIRELRDEEGMQIKSDKDRPDLKPGQYILASLDRLPALNRNISLQMRNEILERNGYTCQRCGAGCCDSDPFNPNRKIRLHVDHILPLSQGGTDDRDNLQVLCSACNQTRSNIQTPSETALNILARIRKAPRNVRREIYEKLRSEFENQ